MSADVERVRKRAGRTLPASPSRGDPVQRARPWLRETRARGGSADRFLRVAPREGDKVV